jgi:transcriptional regulator with XRE-family HTH domain
MDAVYKRFCDLLNTFQVKPSDISRATGISPTVFSEWKKGKARPKADKLQKIADYFNVTMEYLMTGEIPSLKKPETPPDKATELYEKYLKASPEVQKAVELLLKADQ